MRSWWESLQPRERLILGAGGAIAVLIVFWEFAWKPLTEGRALLRESIAASEQLLTEVVRAGALEGSASAAPQAEQQTLFVLVDRTAQAAGLGNAITRARPDGSNAINVTFSNASFDSLIGWLITLNQSNGIYVDGASINSARQQGLVSGQILLRRG